jgi:hypothetical protein
MEKIIAYFKKGKREIKPDRNLFGPIIFVETFFENYKFNKIPNKELEKKFERVKKEILNLYWIEMPIQINCRNEEYILDYPRLLIKDNNLYLYNELDSADEDVKVFILNRYSTFNVFLSGKVAKQWIKETEREVEKLIKREVFQILALAKQKGVEKKEFNGYLLDRIGNLSNGEVLNIDFFQMREILNNISLVRKQRRILKTILKKLEINYPVLNKFLKKETRAIFENLIKYKVPIKEENDIENLRKYLLNRFYQRYYDIDSLDYGFSIKDGIELLRNYKRDYLNSLIPNTKNMTNAEILSHIFNKNEFNIFDNIMEPAYEVLRIEVQKELNKLIKDLENQLLKA